jgi:phosphoglycolate phosphatase-like HAD superfamily hydrolase
MIRVVVFDFDGTLVDSNRIKSECLLKTVAHLEGGPALMSEVHKQGGDRFEIFDEFSRRYFRKTRPQDVKENSKALADRYGQYCYRRIAAAAERRGARHALTTLHRRGVRLWILSATPAEPLQDALHRRGLYRWLRGAVGGPVSKTEGLRLILQHERVQRNELLMVGDGFDDEEAARGMKIRFAGITLERRLPVRGRFALRDLYRLPSLVEEFGGRARRTSRRS